MRHRRPPTEVVAELRDVANVTKITNPTALRLEAADAMEFLMADMDRLRDEVAYLTDLADKALGPYWAPYPNRRIPDAAAAIDVPVESGHGNTPKVTDKDPIGASTGTTPVNDILPRRGMPRHALDELAVDAANERRREQDRWGL